MPIDGFFIKGVTYELAPSLYNSKVNRIYQPNSHTLLFKLYRKAGKVDLLLSAHPSYGRLHLTTRSFKQPSYPPSFCMLLRKFLIGASITAIEQFQGDRIVDIYFKRTDEFDLTNHYLLTCELMGKHSNIILVNIKNNRILDALKRIERSLSTERELFPGVLFERPPNQGKINPHEKYLTTDMLKKSVDNHYGHFSKKTLEKFFLNTFQGVSPFLARKIIKYSHYETYQDLNGLVAFWETIKTKLEHLDIEPAISTEKESGKVIDVYWDRVFLEEDNYKIKVFSSPGKALDLYAYYKETEAYYTNLWRELYKQVSKKLTKAKRKLKKQQLEFQQAEDGEKYRKYGELLSANYHLIEKKESNQKTVRVYDYFQDPPGEIEIPIDFSKTPGENIESYFNKYKKAVKRLKKLGRAIYKTKHEIKYLENLVFQIEEVDNLQELEEIYQEATTEGYVQKTNKQTKTEKTRKDTQSEFIQYYSSDGFNILVGRNNAQNDYLTQKVAAKDHLWLHTKEIAGSHVIVQGKHLPENTIKEAAEIAAYHSKARHSENVPVDYTLVKYVKKPKGAKPGMVIYDNYKTIYVKPKTEKRP